MDVDMVAMFPNGIRALMIDDDTKFLKSATTLLSILNFDVVRCSSVAYALKSFTSGDLEGFDVILVHAANAAACGFDFRAIVETDLLIPVIYFLEEDYEATGDEADELLRTLQAAGSYIIKKPLDIDEVRTRLWTVIAFRKCDLETKASRGGVAGLGVGGKDEDRVHFKVVMKGRGRKRKGSSSSSKHGGSSGTAAAAGGHPSAKGKEKENVGSQQQWYILFWNEYDFETVTAKSLECSSSNLFHLGLRVEYV
ncbi:two-component response regulator ORR33 [Setaria italica]|uniref:two-component response regulator ORR33 n=1 Tax=Setaria italica TaxID=4555 RepID=UPI0007199E70|nr:two-component response regulator ORR33 [Setaria italica]